MSYYLKDPQTRVDYSIDWGASYLHGQTIATSQWSVNPDEPGGIGIDVSSHDAQRAAVTLTGGLPGHIYRVDNRVTLSNGRSDQRSLTLRVEER